MCLRNMLHAHILLILYLRYLAVACSWSITATHREKKKSTIGRESFSLKRSGFIEFPQEISRPNKGRKNKQTSN